ncbi:nickel pincer cofactor biosynthesis protein LarB [Salimicrobium halophilum]|uniref:PurE domain-containing protein n=1 Tax=Salimicrobium halophilum TaxID=86666 RepID=A0A1G8RLE0_9BACI|nr:hypothetical protein SAMN04490247_1076 [Salimicrobium halophilum]
MDDILQALEAGELSAEQAKVKLTSYDNLGFAKVDRQRQERTGFPEVVYGEGKTADEIIRIFRSLKEHSEVLLATRIDEEKGRKIVEVHDDCTFDERSGTVYKKKPLEDTEHYIAVVCAGTSDLAVAEEAAITAEVFGVRVERVYDVGVAGLHRLLGEIERIRAARVSIVVAGMEGALPSVVGGLVAHPVLAVPTSVGYGANFGGVSALLSMLNSCSSGISVVNIDNGFGAAYNAVMIEKMAGS